MTLEKFDRLVLRRFFRECQEEDDLFKTCNENLQETSEIQGYRVVPLRPISEQPQEYSEKVILKVSGVLMKKTPELVRVKIKDAIQVQVSTVDIVVLTTVLKILPAT